MKLTGMLGLAVGGLLLVAAIKSPVGDGPHEIRALTTSIVTLAMVHFLSWLERPS